MSPLNNRLSAYQSLQLAGLTKPAIDAHTHIWSSRRLPEVITAAAAVRPDLQRDFNASLMLEQASANGIESVMFVQARDPDDGAFEEAAELSRLTSENPRVAGFIAGFDLRDAKKAVSGLNKLQKLPGLRGVRMIAPENSGVGMYSTPDAFDACREAGERGLTVDVLIRAKNPGQLQEIERFLDRIESKSQTCVVIDHLAKPDGIGQGDLGNEWLRFMKRIGGSKRFFVKLSALRGEAGSGAERTDFFPYYDAALDTFGKNRLIFGSDHPVSFDYAACVLDVSEWVRARAAHERVARVQALSNDEVSAVKDTEMLDSVNLANSIFRENAVEAYRLPQPS